MVNPTEGGMLRKKRVEQEPVVPSGRLREPAIVEAERNLDRYFEPEQEAPVRERTPSRKGMTDRTLFFVQQGLLTTGVNLNQDDRRFLIERFQEMDLDQYPERERRQVIRQRIREYSPEERKGWQPLEEVPRQMKPGTGYRPTPLEHELMALDITMGPRFTPEQSKFSDEWEQIAKRALEDYHDIPVTEEDIRELRGRMLKEVGLGKYLTSPETDWKEAIKSITRSYITERIRSKKDHLPRAQAAK